MLDRGDCLGNDCLRLLEDPIQMFSPEKALGVNPIEIFGSRGTDRKPSILGNYFQSADGCAVARRASEDGFDRLASQISDLDLLRRKFSQNLFFCWGCRSHDPIVNGITEFPRQFSVNLTRIAVHPGCYFGCQ